MVPANRLSLVVMWAAALHIVWAIVIILTHQTFAFTNAEFINGILPNPYIQGGFLLVVSTLALTGLVWKKLEHSISRLFLLIPQQLVLMVSAGSSISAIIYGHYGDGVARTWQFILLDQSPFIVGTGIHTYIVIIVALTAAKSIFETLYNPSIKRIDSVDE